MRSLRLFGSLVLAAALTSCGGGSDGGHDPEPGPLTLTLNTPNADDGAILFKVTGGVVDSISAGVMVEDGSYAAVTGGTRVVVAGNITDGVLAHIWVPDVADAGNYAVTVEQVSIRTAPYTQRTLTGYSIAVSAP